MDTSPVVVSRVVPPPPILTSSEPNHGAMKLYEMQTHFRTGLPCRHRYSLESLFSFSRYFPQGSF